jgi:hypothetical protein
MPVKLAEGGRYRLPGGLIVVAHWSASRRLWLLREEGGRGVWGVSPSGRLVTLAPVSPARGLAARVRHGLMALFGVPNQAPAPSRKRPAGRPRRVVLQRLPAAPAPRAVQAGKASALQGRVRSGLGRILLVIDDPDDEENMDERLRLMLEADEEAPA